MPNVKPLPKHVHYSPRAGGFYVLADLGNPKDPLRYTFSRAEAEAAAKGEAVEASILYMGTAPYVVWTTPFTVKDAGHSIREAGRLIQEWMDKPHETTQIRYGVRHVAA